MTNALNKMIVLVALILLSPVVFSAGAASSPAPAASSGVLQPMTQLLNPLVEYRYCGVPARNLDGSIKRSSSVIRAYQRLHPCPANGQKTGVCPGWAIDHVVPLAKGGCDSVVNMSWMPNKIKSCADPWCKDRWERVYYGDPFGIVDLTK